ncbi:EcsC family protein [Acidocella sp.]|uniref:EcsC family protein n=1 Tax=Acidocella sp. TaxID=50710 RepID=UPI00179C228A|nr:EcsC family protein [Acidocella sp.]NNM56557.1 EcsC family protein [Acidocella sp.]
MFQPDMKNLPPLPDSLADTAAFLTPHEREELWRAAIIMADSRGLLMRVTSLFGRRIEALRARLAQAGGHFGGEAWVDITQHAQDSVEETLWRSYNLATFGLTSTARPRRPHGNRVHRLATAASGAASGFIGLPGVLFDIPFTTTAILRSIAQVARDSGEDLATEDTRRACLEVLAFGGPGAADDESETGYWAARLGLSHLSLNLLIKSAAGRFGVVLSEKLLAQAVPVAGAITGSALNYGFTRYYQNMAQVQFCLRALDRRTGEPAAVHQAFTAMLREARARHRINRRATPAQDAVFLPR